MAEGLMTIGIILMVLWFFTRKKFDFKPGSKNWAMNTESRLSDSEEANNIVYRLQEEMVNSEHRLAQVEMDLERMNAIINMYKEFANIHKQEHVSYGWTENIPNRGGQVITRDN